MATTGNSLIDAILGILGPAATIGTGLFDQNKTNYQWLGPPGAKSWANIALEQIFPQLWSKIMNPSADVTGARNQLSAMMKGGMLTPDQKSLIESIMTQQKGLTAPLTNQYLDAFSKLSKKAATPILQGPSALAQVRRQNVPYTNFFSAEPYTAARAAEQTGMESVKKSFAANPEALRAQIAGQFGPILGRSGLAKEEAAGAFTKMKATEQQVLAPYYDKIAQIYTSQATAEQGAKQAAEAASQARLAGDVDLASRKDQEVLAYKKLNNDNQFELLKTNATIGINMAQTDAGLRKSAMDASISVLKSLPGFEEFLKGAVSLAHIDQLDTENMFKALNYALQGRTGGTVKTETEKTTAGKLGESMYKLLTSGQFSGLIGSLGSLWKELGIGNLFSGYSPDYGAVLPQDYSDIGSWWNTGDFGNWSDLFDYGGYGMQ